MTKNIPVTITKLMLDLFKPNFELLKIPPKDNEQTSNDKEVIKVLFLDVDGVLNSHKTQVIFGKTPFPGYDSTTGFVDDADATDKLAAELINKICESTGAYIVVSSSWRIGCTIGQLKLMMDKLGVSSGRIIGKTSQINASRGHQIGQWIDMFNDVGTRKHLIEQGHLVSEYWGKDAVVGNYAIVDDDDDMLDTQKHHFVQTTFMDGLTCELAIKLGQILSDDPLYYLNALAGKASAGQEWEDSLK